ncbi:hypothetical protein DAT35_48210 [Vitiosangium sp. GDMCC 1.1324]|nr:hypothetical protein DAT35_48210 [Vitiosangium sp. GDMCC 1.1324]
MLEALSAGEQIPESPRAHVEGCPTCGGQLAALTEARDAFLRARPSERFLRQLERRAATRPAPALWRRLVPVLAVCVPVLALVVLMPRVLPSGSGVNYKGNEFRVVAARAGGTPELLGPDSPVRTGDALRFAYEAPEAGHLLVLELDGRGMASVFHPFGGGASVPVAALHRDFLPGSVVLDDAPGPEWLFAIFSPRPLDAAPLLAQLRTQAGRAEPSLSCPDCRVSVLRLQKPK